MTPTPHASHARRAAEAAKSIHRESWHGLTYDQMVDNTAALVQQAIDAATADIKDQWRLSSVCREKQEEIDKLKAALAAARSLLGEHVDYLNKKRIDMANQSGPHMTSWMAGYLDGLLHAARVADSTLAKLRLLTNQVHSGEINKNG